MLALPHGPPSNRRYRPVAADFHHGMPRQIWRKVFRDGDRAHARTTAPVGNGKCLVQIEMTDVRADRRRAGQADLRVHVGAVHVDLPAVLWTISQISRMSSSNTP